MASRWFRSLLLLLCALCARSLDTAYSLTTDGPQSLVEGERIFEEGDYERAAIYFWRAVLFQEQNKDKYTVEDAYGKFMQCFAVQDRIADGFVFIARESLQRGQKPMALQYVQQALQMEPMHEEAQSILAKIEGREDPFPKRTTSKSDNKFQPRFGTPEAENPLEGKSATDLYEYGSTMFSRKNYEYCADAFELSCLRSEFELGPSCSNAVYCRMLLTDWGFNGTQFDKDIERLETLTIKEIAMNRDGSGDEVFWRRACSVHPHMMLGYPMDPKLKKLVTESVAALDEMMARVDGHGGLIPLPDGMPFEHKSRRSAYIEEASAPGFKLKVGFVSSGFNSKAVLMLSQDIFRFYDRSKIEMHIFSLGPEDNPNFIKIGMGGVDWRKRVAGHVDYFHDIANIKDSHVEMAKYIHERGIHILIEWDGFARQGERAQGLMGLRPAPIQILHQEYLGTSGAKYVDYLFSDKIVTPPNLVDDLYTEKIIYMPNHFFSKGHAVQKEVTPPRHEYLPRKVPYELGYGSPQENRCMASGIKQPTFVFCNFNKFLKNNPETVRSWIKILREVPGSIICLLENPASGVPYLKRFIHEATGEPTTFKNPLTGEEEPDFIPGDGEDIVNRIHFLPWERSPFVHQQRNQDFCNVMLDSHPYNGHTVAQDALYAGVPIVTRSDGDDMSSRVTTSANIVLGIEEMNAYGGSAEYAEIAIDVATNATKFRDIRGRLVDTALQRNPMHPYWDAPRYTKNLENGWFQAWDRFLSGLPPEHITVVEDAETARGSFNDILERFPSDPVPKEHDELPVSTRPGRRRPRTVISTVGWKARAPPLEAFSSFWWEHTFANGDEERATRGSDVVNDAVNLSQDDTNQQNAMEVDTPSDAPQVQAAAALPATAEKPPKPPAPFTETPVALQEKEKATTTSQAPNASLVDLEGPILQDVWTTIVTKEAKDSAVPGETPLDKDKAPSQESGSSLMDMEDSILQEVENVIATEEAKESALSEVTPPDKDKAPSPESGSSLMDMEDSILQDVENSIATEEAKDSVVPEETPQDEDKAPAQEPGSSLLDLEDSILQGVEDSIATEEAKNSTTQMVNRQDKASSEEPGSSLMDLEDAILQDVETSIVRAEEEDAIMTELEEGFNQSTGNGNGGEETESQGKDVQVSHPLDNLGEKSQPTSQDWKKKPPALGEPHERNEKGIVYKWCQNCFGGRGTWQHGADAHLTVDHKSPGELLWERAEQTRQQANPGNWKKVRPGPGDPLEVNDNGTVYRWCDLCSFGGGSWNYGTKAHFTKDHKRPKELAKYNRELARKAQENSIAHAPTTLDPTRTSMDPAQHGQIGDPSSKKRPHAETNNTPPSKLPRRSSSSLLHKDSSTPKEAQNHDSATQEHSFTMRLPRVSEELKVATDIFRSEVVEEFYRTGSEGKTIHANLSVDKEDPKFFSLTATAVDKGTLMRFEKLAVHWAEKRSQELLSRRSSVCDITSLTTGSKTAPNPSPQVGNLSASTGRKPINVTSTGKEQLPAPSEKSPKTPPQKLVHPDVDSSNPRELHVGASATLQTAIPRGVGISDVTTRSASNSPVPTKITASVAADRSQTTKSPRSLPSTKGPFKSIELDRFSSMMHLQEIFDIEEFQKDLARVYKRLHTEIADFEARIAVHPEKAEKYLVTLKGNSRHYLQFESVASRWVAFKDKLLQMRQTLADEDSYLLDVEVEMGKSIGATLTTDPLLQKDTKPLNGVWFDHVKGDGELSNKLGVEKNLRGVMLFIGGKPCQTAHGVREQILQFKSNGCKTCTLSLCLPKDIDLSNRSLSAVRNLRHVRNSKEATSKRAVSSTEELKAQKMEKQSASKNDDLSLSAITTRNMNVPEQEDQVSPKGHDHPSVDPTVVGTAEPASNHPDVAQNGFEPNRADLPQNSTQHLPSVRGLHAANSTAMNPSATQQHALQAVGLSPNNNDLRQRQSQPDANAETANNKETLHKKFLLEIRADMRSVELEILFSSKEPLGGSLRYPPGMNIGCLHDMKYGSALFQVLGPDVCSSFVAVARVNGRKPRTINDFKEIKQKAQAGRLVLVLWVPYGTNLSKIDTTKLLKPPCRRDGEAIGSISGQGAEKPKGTEAIKPRKEHPSESNSTSEGVARSAAATQIGDPSSALNGNGKRNHDAIAEARTRLLSESERTSTPKPVQVLNRKLQKDTETIGISKSNQGGSFTDANSHRSHDAVARFNKVQSVGLQAPSTSDEKDSKIDGVDSTTSSAVPGSTTFQQVADTSASQAIIDDRGEGNSGLEGVDESGPIAGTEIEEIAEGANNDTAGDDKTAEKADVHAGPTDTTQAKPSASQNKHDHERRGPGYSKGDFFRVSPVRRKERTADLKELSQPIQGTTSSALVRKRNIDRSQSLSLRGPNRQIGRNVSNSRPSYVEATFDTQKGLGAYFVTANNTCKISSIWYSGQVAKHYRIRTGMVVAYCDNGRDIQIRNHAQLKRLYDEGRKATRKLKLKLLPLPTDPEGSIPFDYAVHDKDWTFDGKWRGSNSDGWDGGTDAELRMESPTYQKSPIIEEEAPPEDEEEEDEYVPHDPIEINSSESDSASQAGDTDVDDDTILVSSHLERLRHAVQEESCARVIEALEDNALSDKDVIEHGLKKIYEELKECLGNKIQDHKKNPGNKELEKEIYELQGKKTVLNIFINSEYCLEKAFGLEDWAWFEIRLKRAAVDFLGNDYEQVNTVGEVRIRIEDNQTILNFIPNFFSPAEIDFDQRGDVESAKTTNNTRIAMKKRYLEVEFVDAKNPDVQLCLFQTPMNRVSEICPRCNEPALLDIPPIQTDPRVVSCEVVMEVCRIHADGKYMLDKTKESAKAIASQLESIARFNSEHSSDVKVNPNVKGNDGVTLLHAAVHLRRVDLVKRLLEMGADPTSKSSSKGTPLKMAVAAVQKIKKKIEQLEKSKAPPAAIAMKQALLKDFDAILNALRGALH